jgi:hypothetical protein
MFQRVFLVRASGDGTYNLDDSDLTEILFAGMTALKDKEYFQKYQISVEDWDAAEITAKLDGMGVI